MINSKWNGTGWERLQHRAESLKRRIGSKGSVSPEKAGSVGSKSRSGMTGMLGVICLDLETLTRPQTSQRKDGDWNDWLHAALPGENVWFGDELSGHLWVCAEMEAGDADAAEAKLTALACRLRAAMFGTCRTERCDEGFGVSALVLESAGSLREAVYRTALDAVSRMRVKPSAKEIAGGGELHREMAELLRERSIRSVYQPIMRIATGEVFGYEALTRCPSGSRFDGPLSLFRFAEREGYAYALDRLAREQAIRSSPKLSAVQKIFINVTSGIMNDPHFVSGQTVQWLRQRGLHPGQVVLELTERSSIEDFAEAKRILYHYRRQGYEIAIDDAGAGYSSLQSIVELRPDFIKIDKSLVQNADRDEMKKQMLRTFVRFARRMSIATVAEGIERPEELRLLRTLGVDFGQGYLLGRPGEYGTDTKRGLP